MLCISSQAALIVVFNIALHPKDDKAYVDSNLVAKSLCNWDAAADVVPAPVPAVAPAAIAVAAEPAAVVQAAEPEMHLEPEVHHPQHPNPSEIDEVSRATSSLAAFSF